MHTMCKESYSLTHGCIYIKQNNIDLIRKNNNKGVGTGAPYKND